MILPDPVPLGVSGSVTVPLAQYLASGGTRRRTEQVLVSDGERTAYVASRLAEAFQRPLTAGGSESVARSVLEQLPDVDQVLLRFAEKGIETLRDGERHDRMAVSTDTPQVGVWFIAWNGTHREVQSQRFGNYLEPLAGAALRLTQRGILLAGFLEIDAYLRECLDSNDPTHPLEEIFHIDVEFSFLPGIALGFPKDTPNPLPRAFLVNRDLCSPKERHLLEKLMA